MAVPLAVLVPFALTATSPLQRGPRAAKGLAFMNMACYYEDASVQNLLEQFRAHDPQVHLVSAVGGHDTIAGVHYTNVVMVTDMESLPLQDPCVLVGTAS